MKDKLSRDHKEEVIILGIDPGTNAMGFGLICCKNQKVSLISVDEFKLKKADSHYLRLKKIFEKTLSVIKQYYPDEISIEAPFFGRNVQSMLKLGRAQGVAMAAGLSQEIPIVEYAPRKVKQAITGNGSASKEQVAKMLKSLLKISEFTTSSLDASDGLAVAFCHYLNRKSISADSKYNTTKKWDSFIRENPSRVKK